MTRILLIDDEDLVRRAYCLALDKAGFETVDLGSGKLAVERFHGIAPDLVIVDLVMPDQSGFETINQIRQLKPDQLFITITGGGPMGPDKLVERARAMGVRIALKKPLDRADLISAVEAAIDGA